MLSFNIYRNTYTLSNFMKHSFVFFLVLGLALPGLAHAGCFAEFGVMGARPQSPQQYAVEGSAVGGSFFTGYDGFKGLGLGAGFDYQAVSGSDGNKVLSVADLGLQYDFLQPELGTPFLRITGGYNLAAGLKGAWPGQREASISLGYNHPIASHAALQFSLGEEMASPMGSGLQMPFIKLAIQFGSYGIVKPAAPSFDSHADIFKQGSFVD